MTCPLRCLRMTGRTARVTFSGPKKFVSICARNCSVTDLLEVAGVEVTGVVDENVDASKASDCGFGGGSRGCGVGDIQRQGKKVLVFAESCGDFGGVAGGGDDAVAGVEGGLGQIDAHAAGGSGNEPNVGHDDAFLRS